MTSAKFTSVSRVLGYSKVFRNELTQPKAEPLGTKKYRRNHSKDACEKKKSALLALRCAAVVANTRNEVRVWTYRKSDACCDFLNQCREKVDVLKTNTYVYVQEIY